uniref:Glycosyltransferase 2-like domain-containing protein n=1 Tax=viral metagenome TaxID=1070528 RepID=A0A6C0HG57_9ZZZZ
MKILCHESEYKYMKEYVESFSEEVVQYSNSTTFEVDEYMCVRRIPNLPEGSKIKFLNTEQLCVPEKMAEYKAFISRANEIFDYSESNIKLSGKGTYLPYKERAQETEKLRGYLDVPKEFDVVVVGTHSERRKQIIEELRSQFLRVHWITDLFGDERDKQIGKAHILLNLHYSDSYKEFESIRCNRWKWAGMRVLTEPCIHVPDGISVVELDKIYPKLVKMLGPQRLPRYKVGLSMIVKNESHIVHEVLNSSLPFIDTFCILDTGSTDNTVQIIRDFYASKGISGIVHQSDWKGFGKSRSEALKLCDGQMDYILMIDADDLIEGPPNVKEFLLKVLYMTTPNACNIHLKRGTLEYERTQIFKAKDGWRYEGVLHEYPTNDKEKNIHVRLPKEIWMTGRTIGARSMLEGNKYQRDAETILEALKEEPENMRYMFYLAQSYRDAGMRDESITWYKKRFDAGGWIEEQFICALNLTRLLGCKEWAWKAHEICPNRIESLVSYMSLCRSQGKWSRELLSMCLYASSIPKPEGTFLFLESDTYDWKVWDETSIVATYCKAYDVAKVAYIRLLKENKYPPEQEARIRENFKQTLMLAQKS